MLTNIHVKNFITIESLLLDFSSGTTVITGESGAGKSILMDAIELALGARATHDMIRIGQEKAEVLLTFDISHSPLVTTWLTNFDFENNTTDCIIRRIIHQDGRTRCYINGTPSTLQQVRDLGELLIHIHSQHEHQALLKPDRQRNMLDHFAGNADVALTIEKLAKDWQILSQKISHLETLLKENNNKCELLQFQMNELKELNVLPDEFQLLELEHKQLSAHDTLTQHIATSLHILTENEETNVLNLLNQTRAQLEAIQRFDNKIISWLETLNHAIINIHDIEQELRHYLDRVDSNPERLHTLEERISTLFHTARKYKIAPHELLDCFERLKTEYSILKNSDEQRIGLKEKLNHIEQSYQKTAALLSQKRLDAAKKLANIITQTIKQLALPHAIFDILLEKDVSTKPSASGLEKVIFHIQTNAGQPLQPLAKIASGGELSRISLAIHLATAEQYTLPTLLFDEVDIGIGGATAEMIGKLLRKLGESRQVLCITHSPQVASCGHHHYRVEKITTNNTTLTNIHPLSSIQKIDEIARMLGGIEMTEKTLAHAKEMVENFN